MLAEARATLARGMSLMIFPEGTRSPDGELGRFKDGAFELAIASGAPILPVVVDGTHHCRPKGSWWFGEADAVAKVLPPIATEGLTMADVPALREQVRATIASELVRLRNAPLPPVAALIAPDMALPAAVAAAMLTAASAAPRPTSASTESGARGDDMGEHE